MKLMKKGRGAHYSLSGAPLRSNTKNRYQFWQNAFWACCTAKIRQ